MDMKQLMKNVHGVLVGDNSVDNVVTMMFDNGQLTLNQHDRKYDGFDGPVRGQSLSPSDVLAVQAYGDNAAQLTSLGFRVVDSIEEFKAE